MHRAPVCDALQEIKGYYNEITHSNLDLIHTLKEELHELKRKEAADDKLMYDIAQENKRMTEPLKRALADIETLTTEREAYRCVCVVFMIDTVFHYRVCVDWRNRRMPKFSPYGSVCCACAQKPGFPRASLSRAR